VYSGVRLCLLVLVIIKKHAERERCKQLLPGRARKSSRAVTGHPPCHVATSARNTIEVGVFTTALALPDEYFELGRPYIEKADVVHKLGGLPGGQCALERLDHLLSDEAKHEGRSWMRTSPATRGTTRSCSASCAWAASSCRTTRSSTGPWRLPSDAPMSDRDRLIISAAVRDLNASIAAARCASSPSAAGWCDRRRHQQPCVCRQDGSRHCRWVWWAWVGGVRKNLCSRL
jgi:hypothetical protein